MKNLKWKRIAKACTERFSPALIDCFKEGYTLKTFMADAVAGLIVAAVALPLAIAFAIAAGLPPQAGLVTAVIAGFAISAFGGCRVQIGGPTGAFIVIIYGIYSQFGMDGLMLATLMAGVMLIILGLCGLGSIIKYIPYPVTVGFTSGIALIIFAGQIEALLGLTCTDALKALALDKMPGDFVGKLNVYVHAIGTVNWFAVAISALTVCICVFWKKVTQKVPGSIVAILVTTVIAILCEKLWGLEVLTIGKAFPAVKDGMGIPAPALPSVSWDEVRQLFSPAISIALLAGIESLLSAVVADGMIGKRHNSNTELIGEGIANVLSPLFGGIPATGAIARTATNVKNGGVTPMAGIFHALFLLIIMLFLGQYAALIPMATLGGVVAIVAYNMSEWHLVKGILKSTRSDILVMATSFLLTVFIDLTVAIQAGVLLAAFLFIRRMGESTEAKNVTRLLAGEHQATASAADDLGSSGLEIPRGVEVFEVYGALFFGAADKFKRTLLSGRRRPKVLILRMRHVLVLDATALHSLEEVYAHTRSRGVTLVLSGVTAQPMMLMVRSGFLDKIGQENVHGHISEAIARSRDLIQ